VRTIAGPCYWVGGAPANWDDEYGELRPWPPSSDERSEIDASYERALAKVREEEAARAAYEEARGRWLAEHAPHPADAGTVAHECLLFMEEREATPIEFEELSADGGLCGARRSGGPGACGFGSAEQAIAAASSRAPADPWVQAVCRALVSERAWERRGRRLMLLVARGEDEMFHVTAASNRDSIRRHGLDWRRMTAPGIAGSPDPELPGIFLCSRLEYASGFLRMARVPSHVWAVDVAGLWLEGDPGGDSGGSSAWMILPQAIGPERVRLIETDVPVRSAPF